MNNSSQALDELLLEFNNIKTWNARKKGLKIDIIKYLESEGYLFFVGSKHIYQLTKIGQRRKLTINDLSEQPLDRFKDKDVQLICLGQEHCDYMHLAAKEITK
jgi:hypothetical protein